MSDIFREVDEALQREKAAQFWKANGPTIILAIIVLIASTAITTAYKTWDLWRDHQETSKLLSAQTAEDSIAAYTEAAKDTRKGHKALALLSAGNAAAEKKDFVKASDLYSQAAADNSAPADLRDLATILAVRAIQLHGDASPNYKELADKLAPIAQNDKSAFQLLAKLDIALIQGAGLKDYAAALKNLEGFDKDNTSAMMGSLEEKARALRHVYEYEQAKTSQP